MLPEEYLDLIDAPLTAVLASIGPDGMPHASPVWFVRDGDDLLVSTTNDRQKFRNLRDRPVASITIVDPDTPLRYLEVRADVTIEPDDANEIRDRIGARQGFDAAALDPVGTIRVVIRLTPRQVIRH
jgi:PPOX class probable F420-dependent enzyme